MRGTWCTKNGARTLFPVDARSDKTTVRKTSIITLVYLFILHLKSTSVFYGKKLEYRYISRGILGHCIYAKISPKAASEKASQTTVSGNRYSNPIIDVFRTVVLSLLASTGNSVRAPFWYTRYHVPLLQSGGIVFAQFSLRVRVSNHPWRPMIAGLLYCKPCGE